MAMGINQESTKHENMKYVEYYIYIYNYIYIYLCISVFKRVLVASALIFLWNECVLDIFQDHSPQ